MSAKSNQRRKLKIATTIKTRFPDKLATVTAE